ncbi:MAG: mannose-6-phosphate isomerase, class I [Lactobacillaceae bacterium]|jgi:mannose-6-phosphate isomerase|nr:mannose-6-phosphate isomerase, class I [Lactobacillaceae bacterium]
MAEPIFLKPVLHEKMWGGTAIREQFGFDLPSETTGEAWIVSGHPNGVSPIETEKYASMTLAQLWQARPDLFDNNDPERPYPLLVKFLDANKDLSVQVHPGDAYAAEHNNGELGKTESWYILAATPDAQIYFGHNAKTKAEFNEMVDNGEWDKLLRKEPVKAGDFYYVPAGTLHALGAGVLAIETQQSSDVTYRVYDFDRPDPETGVLRELHLEDAKNVTTIPFTPAAPEQSVVTMGALKKTTLVAAPYFSVFKVEVNGDAYFTKQAPYTQATVISGSGSITIERKEYPLALGQSFIIPAHAAEWQISGDLTIISSTPGPLSR